MSISYFGVKTAPALTTVRNHAGESANVAHFEVGATESIESWLRMLFEECHADVAQCTSEKNPVERQNLEVKPIRGPEHRALSCVSGKKTLGAASAYVTHPYLETAVGERPARRAALRSEVTSGGEHL